jgi:hypothetical protein
MCFFLKVNTVVAALSKNLLQVKTNFPGLYCYIQFKKIHAPAPLTRNLLTYKTFQYSAALIKNVIIKII